MRGGADNPFKLLLVRHGMEVGRVRVPGSEGCACFRGAGTVCALGLYRFRYWLLHRSQRACQPSPQLTPLQLPQYAQPTDS